MYASPDLNAECYLGDTSNCIIRFSSSLIDILDKNEFEFVVGHELGHFLLSHQQACVTEKNLEYYIQQRAQEISADRLGLIACDSLDIALKGEGWIAIQSADGSEAYTRAGNLSIDVNGQLRTGAGFPVLGDGGPLVIPPAATVEVGADGTISVIPLGGEGLAQVDRIRLVNPNADSIEKSADGLIHLKEGAAPPAADGVVRVEQGFLEGSNVNAVSSLTDMLSLCESLNMQELAQVIYKTKRFMEQEALLTVS